MDVPKTTLDPGRPVLLVGTAPRVALAAARSLWSRGITVVAVPSAGNEGKIPTRAIRSYFALPDALREPAAFDAGLERVIEHTGAGVIMPCSDAALAAIARNEGALRRIAAPACPGQGVVARVLDKSATVAFAQTIAIDVPETYEVGATSTAREAASVMRFPVVAKPRHRVARGGYRIRYFTNADELEAAFADDPAFDTRYVVQQYVPGTGAGVAVLMRGGEPVATFVHNRLKELPASGGVSVVSESARPDRQLIDKAVALLRAIGWEGVAQVEFRRAPDGRDWLMEVNGRFWGTLSTAIAAGVDFPYYQWEVVHGRTPDVPRSYAVGVRVRWTHGAILRLRERLFEPPAFMTEALPARDEWRSFDADLAYGVRSAMWSARDPLPAIADVRVPLVRFANSVWQAGLKPLVPHRVLRARRRFGALGAVRYAWLTALRKSRLRSDALPRPFAPRTVLFVCTGNVMRSVLAAEVFSATLLLRGVDDVVVESAGVHAVADEPPDRRTIAFADSAGLDVAGHMSKRADDVHPAAFDAVFVMDRMQELEILERFPAAAKKTHLLGYCLAGYPRLEILDPSLASDRACRNILAIVYERAAALAALVADDASHPSAAVTKRRGANGGSATSRATPAAGA